MISTSAGKAPKKLFLFLFSLLLILMLSGAVPLQASTLSNAPKDEALAYDVSIFKIFHALELKMDFHRQGETDFYDARLEVTPTGFLKHLAPYERCEFRSKLRAVDVEKGKGRRLRLEHFEKEIFGKRHYRGVYAFDYEKGVLTGQGFYDERALAPETFALPGNGSSFYDDFLSFFYNLRWGGYGTLKPGQAVEVRWLPTKSETVMTLALLDKDPEARLSIPGARVFRLDVKRRFLGMEIRDLLIWLTAEDLPLHGLAPDVVGWGDVVSVLRRT